eukprot:3186523-Amphidinium_carterae.2
MRVHHNDMRAGAEAPTKILGSATAGLRRTSKIRNAELATPNPKLQGSTLLRQAWLKTAIQTATNATAWSRAART